VRLVIYNVLGQQVKALVDATQGRGVHDVVWDVKDALGHQVTSGVYIYQLDAGNSTATGKMVIAK
jgi:flagellar hook assembly protein FlgD